MLMLVLLLLPRHHLRALLKLGGALLLQHHVVVLRLLRLHLTRLSRLLLHGQGQFLLLLPGRRVGLHLLLEQAELGGWWGGRTFGPSSSSRASRRSRLG